MTNPPGSSSRVSTPRLILLGLILAGGLVLFFTQARRTPVMVNPPESESHP